MTHTEQDRSQFVQAEEGTTSVENLASTIGGSWVAEEGAAEILVFGRHRVERQAEAVMRKCILVMDRACPQRL